MAICFRARANSFDGIWKTELAAFSIMAKLIMFIHLCGKSLRNEDYFIMKKIVVTVVGKDSVGIIAEVCTYLAQNNINILDISQTIVGGFFNMMMIVDVEKCEKNFEVFDDEIVAIGEKMGCIIKAQREEIFDSMHRI